MNGSALKFVALIGVFALLQTAFAHEGAVGITKERMELMQSMNHAMKSIKEMVRGKTPINMDQIEIVARSIADRGEYLTFMFPAGQQQNVSKASTQIWQDPDGFKISAAQMVKAAENLKAAAQEANRAAVVSAFRTLEKACGGCHRQFRKGKRREN